MNSTVMIDWRFVAATGGSTALIILIGKLESGDAKEVLIHAIDACVSYVAAISGSH